MDRRVLRATWVNQENQDRKGDRETPASRGPLDSPDQRVFLASKERRVNLEPTAGRGLPVWLARMEPMDRRASWGASALQAAKETLGTGDPTATQGRQEAPVSKETKVPRGTLAAQDAEGPQGTAGTKEVRDIKATTDPLEALA